MTSPLATAELQGSNEEKVLSRRRWFYTQAVERRVRDYPETMVLDAQTLENASAGGGDRGRAMKQGRAAIFVFRSRPWYMNRQRQYSLPEKIMAKTTLFAPLLESA